MLSNINDEPFARTQVGGLANGNTVQASSGRAPAQHLPLPGSTDASETGPAARLCTSPPRRATPADLTDASRALEAGNAVIRPRPAGHRIDPDGPIPPAEVDEPAAVASALCPTGAADPVGNHKPRPDIRSPAGFGLPPLS